MRDVRPWFAEGLFTLVSVGVAVVLDRTGLVDGAGWLVFGLVVGLVGVLGLIVRRLILGRSRRPDGSRAVPR